MESPPEAPRLVIGLHRTVVAAAADETDAATALQAARSDGYDFVTCGIPSGSSATARVDLTLLESKWWRTSVVGVMEPLSNDTASEEADWTAQFQAALAWSGHMTLPAVLLPPLPVTTIAAVKRYATALASSIATLRDLQLWIPVPLLSVDTHTHTHHAALDVATVFPLFHQWMDHHPAIHLLLVLDHSTLHPVDTAAHGTPASPERVQRHVLDLWRRMHVWIGTCPIAALQLTDQAFLTNKKGFPALPKSYQMIVTALMRRVGRTLKLVVAVTDAPHHALSLAPTLVGRTGTLPYQQYLCHFRSKTELAVLDTPEAGMETPYLDSLQQPLQPLADHLEFQTYEIFEQDPVKYAQYQTAMCHAMRDIMQNSSNATSAAPLIVLVVGAGRGPLVSACLRAHYHVSQDATTRTHVWPLHIYAVEKNPSAVLYLQSKLAHEWAGAPVTIVPSDLRQLTARTLFHMATAVPRHTGPAHLVVSELLGSFGCNELSPECLDALLHHTDVCGPQTISIPMRYTSHAAPVSSLKLHTAVKIQASYPVHVDYSTAQAVGRAAAETPYVVRTHAASQMAHAVECWSFEHGAGATKTTNAPTSRARHAHLQFANTDPLYAMTTGSGYGAMDEIATAVMGHAETSSLPLVAWTCTGIVGTMTADLYRSNATASSPIQISIHPPTFSVGMFSWFPLYFPLSQPVLVPAGATLWVDVWRKCTDRRVWYEWAVQVVRPTDHDNFEVLSASPIHNPGGRSSHVSM